MCIVKSCIDLCEECILFSVMHIFSPSPHLLWPSCCLGITGYYRYYIIIDVHVTFFLPLMIYREIHLGTIHLLSSLCGNITSSEHFNRGKVSLHVVCVVIVRVVQLFKFRRNQIYDSLGACCRRFRLPPATCLPLGFLVGTHIFLRLHFHSFPQRFQLCCRSSNRCFTIKEFMHIFPRLLLPAIGHSVCFFLFSMHDACVRINDKNSSLSSSEKFACTFLASVMMLVSHGLRNTGLDILLN